MTTYYIAPGGNNSNAGTEASPWLTIGKANTTLVAGDKVYIKAGTYSDAIRSTNDGTSDANRITYQAFGNGTVNLTGFSSTGSTKRGAINLSNKSYVSVIGRGDSDAVDVRRIVIVLPSGQVSAMASFNGATGCIMSNLISVSTDTNATNYGIQFGVHSFGEQEQTRFNILRQCHITGNSTTSVSTGVEDLINMGGMSDHCLVEDNIFDGASRHITFNNQGSNGSFIASRGNFVWNNAHTAQSIYNCGPNMLVENSRLQCQAQIPTCIGPECNFGSSLQVGSTNMLIRYNTLFEGCRAPCGFDSQGGIAGGYGGDNVQPVTGYRIYNNTAVDSAGVPFGIANFIGSTSHIIGDGILVNNFFYDGNAQFWSNICIVYRDPTPTVNDRFIRNVVGNPGGSSSEDILFWNDSGWTLAEAKANFTNPTGPDLRDWNGFANVYDAAPGFTNYAANDFTLTSSSPYIDGGAPLTRVAIADTGTGTSLILDDARFFYDVSGFPAWMGVQWDWIAVGPTSNNVTGATKIQLAGINYSTNTVTLTSSITRNDGDYVWLWKDSAGRQVISGTAPNIGALEFQDANITGTVLITDAPDLAAASGAITVTATTGYAYILE